MRKTFAKLLLKQMKVNKDIYLISGDLGFGIFDDIKTEFPDRFINVGASEMAGVGIACGLALEGKIPFFYTITSFLLRAAETINIYLHNEQVPVKLVGSGLFDDYRVDGYSHDGTQAQKYIEGLNIKTFYPQSKEKITEKFLKGIIDNNKPNFIGLTR